MATIFDLARFDWFLDNNPDMRRDLMKWPEVINKHEYMEHHPRLPDKLKDYPREFMDREAHFENGF